MKKIILSLIILLLPLMAMSKKIVYQEAKESCFAYDNMKHTKNSNDIRLKKGQKYRVIEHRKGQILTLIKGEKIAQRWVDENCFSDKKLKEKKITTKKSKQNLLAISWQNAFCQNHQYRRECKSMKSGDFATTAFVLHGLWPQPRNNLYCNVSKKEVGMDKNKQWNRLPKLDLSKKTRDELKKYMSGYSSNLHLHEWIKHGTCYGTNADEYYRDAINLLKQINSSKVREFFVKNMGKVVKQRDIREVFDKEFGKGAGEHVNLVCQKGLITELWIYIGSGSNNLKELLKSGGKVKSRCYKGKIDEVGF